MKYIGMPMGMWVLFSKSFRDKLMIRVCDRLVRMKIVKIEFKR